QQPLPNGWVVKRAFGFAGRAVRRFGSHPTKDDVRWLEDGVRLGGVQLEPWQDILQEYSLLGYIYGAFNVKLGQPCVLLEPTLPSYERVDHQLPGPRSSLALLPTERHQLFSETERVANALIEEGYFGPFGIDAFAYTVGSERRFNP